MRQTKYCLQCFVKVLVSSIWNDFWMQSNLTYPCCFPGNAHQHLCRFSILRIQSNAGMNCDVLNWNDQHCFCDDWKLTMARICIRTVLAHTRIHVCEEQTFISLYQPEDWQIVFKRRFLYGAELPSSPHDGKSTDDSSWSHLNSQTDSWEIRCCHGITVSWISTASLHLHWQLQPLCWETARNQWWNAWIREQKSDHIQSICRTQSVKR